MTQFRTHHQIDEVYKARAERGESGRPYIFELGNEQQMLTFFGASHSNDPHDSQWSLLDAKWQAFVQHHNPKKAVIYENQSTSVTGKSHEESLAAYSESGLVVWLSRVSRTGWQKLST